MSAFVGAIAIADLVKTTLGPKGMDKILQSVRSMWSWRDCIWSEARGAHARRIYVCIYVHHACVGFVAKR